FDPDPRTRYTMWSQSVGSGILWVAIYGVNQAQVQRCLSTPNLRTAQIALWVNLPGLIALLIVCSLCGFVVYAQYRDCDPLTGPKQINMDQDMVRPFCLPKMKDSTAANVSKGIAVGFGALMILLTYVVSHLGGVIQGAYVGFLTGLVATSWLGIGAFVYKPSVYKPPVSLSECPIGNITDVTPMYLNDSTTTTATSRPEDRMAATLTQCPSPRRITAQARRPLPTLGYRTDGKHICLLLVGHTR
ncbi:Sodium/iodide cotransporter, partial [Lamellibrachia satsuma]